jgi:uncharacterized glyoxalase superfamily metalloenzyme YdcJ
LTKAEGADAGLAKRDFAEYQKQYAAPFSAFPRTLPELIEQGLVLACYYPTSKGLAERGTISTTDLGQLVADGLIAREGLRYEDFLPVSAAGIFASNLNQYGTQSTAAAKPTYKKEQLEVILGRAIIDTDAVYWGLQAESIIESLESIGVLSLVSARVRAEWEAESRVLHR